MSPLSTPSWCRATSAMWPPRRGSSAPRVRTWRGPPRSPVTCASGSRRRSRASPPPARGTVAAPDDPVRPRACRVETMENHVTATENAEPEAGATDPSGATGAAGATHATGATALRTRSDGRLGNRIFAGLSTGSGILILVILAAVAAFLLYRAWPALTAGAGAFADVDFMQGRGLWAWVAPLVFGTVLSSVLALVVAVPLSIGIALFISHYAPRRLAQLLGYVIDLLAAIPSVIFGLWGIQWLMPLVSPVFTWLSTRLGFIPLF